MSSSPLKQGAFILKLFARQTICTDKQCDSGTVAISRSIAFLRQSLPSPTCRSSTWSDLKLIYRCLARQQDLFGLNLHRRQGFFRFVVVVVLAVRDLNFYSKILMLSEFSKAAARQCTSRCCFIVELGVAKKRDTPPARANQRQTKTLSW